MNVIADTYAMIQDLNRVSPFMRVWGPALNVPQVIGGLWFIRTLEGALVLIACVATVAAAAQIHKRMPFSRLTSIVHVVWIPLLPLLVESLRRDGLDSLFGIWLAYVVVTMAMSLVLDVWNLSLFVFKRDARFEGADR